MLGPGFWVPGRRASELNPGIFAALRGDFGIEQTSAHTLTTSGAWWLNDAEARSGESFDDAQDRQNKNIKNKK